MTAIIKKVREQFGCLGNMSRHSVMISNKLLHKDDSEGEVVFGTAEGLFQALRFNDKGVQLLLAGEPNGFKAKLLAKGRSEFMVVEQLSEQDLENMRLVLRLKFQQHKEVQDVLALTKKDLIVEDCTNRQRGSGLFWGAAFLGGEWRGQNWLGRLWMEIREQEF